MSRATRRFDREETAARVDLAGLGAGPAYGGRSLPNLAATLFARCDRPGTDSSPTAPELAVEIDPTRGRRPEGTVVLFVIDGLGWNAFRRALRGPAPGGVGPAPEWGDLAHPITSVFPTTTTAALTSLSTGTPPGRHGIVGHRQWLPRFGVVADMLRMAPASTTGNDTLVGPGFDRSDLTGTPTLFERGLRATALSRDRFEGSGFTRLLYEGAEYQPYATASDLAYTLARVLERTDPPEVAFVYWDELDTVQHVRGPDPFLVALELERIQGLVRAVAGRVSPQRRRSVSLWLTGDHGQVAAPDSSNLALDRHPRLLAELSHPPSGDRRAGYFAVRPDHDPSFRARIQPLLPAGTHYLSIRDAVRGGLFGPPPHHPELELRTGTWIVLPPAPVGLTYRAPGSPPPRRPSQGAHGGLDAEELLVPLISGTLGELADAR